MEPRYKLKMRLQKDQLEAQKNRLKQEKEQQANKPATTTQLTAAINLPQLSQTAASVPQNVLQVQSRLANPTQYHVQQKQRSQVKEYLSQSLGNTKAMTQNLIPFNNNNGGKASSLTAATASSQHSTPASPLARLNLSSSIDQQQMDSVIDDIVSSYEDQALLSSTVNLNKDFFQLPTIPQTMLNDFTAQSSQDYHGVQVQDTSSSCPSRFIPKQEFTSGDADLAAYVQDRVKKDNHNRIERKRRYNINDRIKELGTLIPKSNDPHVNRDMRWNKGSILKASVDHMKQLQKKVAQQKQAEMEAAKMRNINKKLLLRMQQLEIMAQSNGLNVPAMDDSQDIMNAIMQPDDNNMAMSPAFTIDQETDISNFPSAVVTSPSGQTFSPGSNQQSRSMSSSPQQFIYQQPSTSFGQSPQHTMQIQPQQQVMQSPQQIVTIDITSPSHSISPQPASDFSSIGITQDTVQANAEATYNHNQSLTDLNMGSLDLDDVLNLPPSTTFTEFLTNPNNDTLNDMLMEDESQGPIKADIFLSEAIN